VKQLLSLARRKVVITANAAPARCM
jgi:hypothetical protein